MDREDKSSGPTSVPPVARELDLVGGRREFKLAGVTVAGRRRRPSGEAAPLPRDLRGSAQLWMAVGVLTVVVWLWLFVVPSSTQWWIRGTLGKQVWTSSWTRIQSLYSCSKVA